MLGLAVGDALGAPLEFSTAEQAAASVANDIEMTGGGTWKPGEWTDDTALALALAESIAVFGLLDTEDVAARYTAWADSGAKDIGIITRMALEGATSADESRFRARQYHEETERTAGNGTIMRAAPIALAARSLRQALDAAREDAVLTHFDPAAGMASAALCASLLAIAAEEDPLEAAAMQVQGHDKLAEGVAAAQRRDEGFLARQAVGPEIGVCWTTLAVGLHSVCAYRDYEEGVSWAIGLGGDTDTNGAVAGALLGCKHGIESIPERWLEPLKERAKLERVAEALVDRAR